MNKQQADGYFTCTVGFSTIVQSLWFRKKMKTIQTTPIVKGKYRKRDEIAPLSIVSIIALETLFSCWEFLISVLGLRPHLPHDWSRCATHRKTSFLSATILHLNHPIFRPHLLNTQSLLLYLLFPQGAGWRPSFVHPIHYLHLLRILNDHELPQPSASDKTLQKVVTSRHSSHVRQTFLKMTVIWASQESTRLLLTLVLHKGSYSDSWLWNILIWLIWT